MTLNVRKLLYVVIPIIGVFYLAYSALELYSWALSFIVSEYGGTWVGLFLPGDVGWFIAEFTVGILMIGSLVKGLEDYRGFSCLFIGSLTGVALLGLQLLVVVASVGDVGVVCFLMGEEASYNLAEGLLTPAVIGGIVLTPLFAYSLARLRKGQMSL